MWLLAHIKNNSFCLSLLLYWEKVLWCCFYSKTLKEYTKDYVGSIRSTFYPLLNESCKGEHIIPSALPKNIIKFHTLTIIR